MSSGLNFDPGFGPYIMAFQGTVDYLYLDINRFKNLSQKNEVVSVHRAKRWD